MKKSKVRSFTSCYLDGSNYLSFRCPFDNHLISKNDSSNCYDCPNFIRFKHAGWPVNRSWVVCKCEPYFSRIQLTINFE